MWIHASRSRTLDDSKPHGAHLIGCMERLLSERRDEQSHQVRSHVPGISRFFE